MKNYAWSDQILKELPKTMEVAAVHPERVNYCVLALLYWLCEHTTLVKKALQSACPRFLKWDLRQLTSSLQSENCLASKLTRAFTVSGNLKTEEDVGATLSSLPDEVVDTVGVTALPSEDSVSERRRKLEFLEMQEELIKEEEERGRRASQDQEIWS